MKTALDQVKKSIGEVLGIPINDVTLEKVLDENLGVDSLDKYEIIMFIEDDLNIEIKDQELYKIVTVDDLVKLVDKTLTEKH